LPESSLGKERHLKLCRYKFVLVFAHHKLVQLLLREQVLIRLLQQLELLMKVLLESVT
jgi:hypothetical protein